MELKISAEVHFCQQLASNQKTIRDRCFKKLKRWLILKSSASNAFAESDMLKLWKGMYYFFWMCDKPLVQEETAEEICKLIHCFQKFECSFLYIDTFFQTMSREWFGIDRYRLEKFMMLIRKFLHQSFTFVMKKKWQIKYIKQFRKVLRKIVLNPLCDSELGFQLHVVDVYMEELAKVGGHELTPRLVRLFLVPFCPILAECHNDIFRISVCKNIFKYLLRQKNNSEVPALKFNPKSIERLLMRFANKAPIRRENMSTIYGLVRNFQNCSEHAKFGSFKKAYKKGPGLNKRTMLKAVASLHAEDEAFRAEKSSPKKKKCKKNINVESDSDYEDVL